MIIKQRTGMYLLEKIKEGAFPKNKESLLIVISNADAYYIEKMKKMVSLVVPTELNLFSAIQKMFFN